MAHSDPIVIVSCARTPIGAMGGSLASCSAPQLGAAAIRAVVDRSGVDANRVEQVIMGCVLAAGLGQAPARQAMLGAGFPTSVAATTINKMCGSGMQAVMMAHDALVAGAADIIVAGGMESMSRAPYLLPKHRNGKRLGHDTIIDSMLLDGLEDAYHPGTSMGVIAEEAVNTYGFTRAAQDDYAIASLQRAQTAQSSGVFARELIEVSISGQVVCADEQPNKGRVDRITALKPAFAENGTITAANASSISDGAAALLLTHASVAHRLGLPVMARIAGCTTHADEPKRFPFAPVPAIKKLLHKTGWSLVDVDLFEINEAFAVVAMIAMRELNIAHEKLNVHGGACALGHPIGASGARILVTLLAALEHRKLRRGIASICIGGGEATAIGVELTT